MNNHLPILRFGEEYESLDTIALNDMRTGETLSDIGQANDGLIRKDLLRIKAGDVEFPQLPAEEIVAACERAGKLFMEGTLPSGLNGATQGPDAFIKTLSGTTGLPYSLCRSNMEKVYHNLINLRTIMSGLMRGIDLSIFDDGIAVQDGLDVSYFPVANSMGVVLPSNSPGVNSLWLPALVMKVPVVLKPGREDPWTPYRLVQALIAAGVPKAYFSFYPAGHDGAQTILSLTSKAIVFGGDATVQQYAHNPNIQPHGAGRSKILIGDDMADRWPEFLDVLASSVAGNSGRSCINASAILIPRHADALAHALAERLTQLKPLSYDHPDAILAGFANPMMADWIESTLEEGFSEAGARDVTAEFRPGPTRVEFEDQNYLLPTITRCDSMEHPLGNTEFLFPYASVVEVSQAAMLDQIGPSLVVTAITKDSAWKRDLLHSANIDRLNFGPTPTNSVQWDQPHEGNLFEFLYRRRAIQRVV